MNKKHMSVIKSVGLNIERGGVVLDDSKGLNEYEGFFMEGEVVEFEEGLNLLKDYVLECKGEVDEESVEGYWKEIEEKLLEIKEEVGERGVWRTWGVEYDMSLGVEIA